jgi:hypothetical protein
VAGPELDEVPLRGEEAGSHVPRLVGSERQQALLSALRERDARLAAIYEGAILVLNQPENPDRLPLTAHNIRELMKLLPGLVDVPAQTVSPEMGNRVYGFMGHWESALKSKCYQATSGIWGGTIDHVLRKFLAKAKELAEWADQNQPRHRKRFIEAMRRFDPSGTSLPEPIEKSLADNWMRAVYYFDGVCHHDRRTIEGDFDRQLRHVEEVILNLLKPRVAEDLSELDELIRVAEGRA